MRFSKTTPILRIFDERKATEFYVDYLGFTIDWTHRFEEGTPLYLQVSRDGCVLHLSEHHGDGCPGSSMRIESDDIEAFHRELTAKRYAYMRPGLEQTEWGSRDVTVIDPFGNRLTFTSAVST